MVASHPYYSQWRELHGSVKGVARGASIAEPVNPDEQIEVLVCLRRKTTLPGPPKAARRMPREMYEARHGADPHDIEKVRAFAENFHLAVSEARAPERSLILKGKIADFRGLSG